MAVKIGDKVKVPNGETGTVSRAFRKDGEARLEVSFGDGTWLIISVRDVTKA